MGKATGDRASRRKRNIIIAKAQRKVAAIRDKAARTGYCTHGIMHRGKLIASSTLVFNDGEIIGRTDELKETGA